MKRAAKVLFVSILCCFNGLVGCGGSSSNAPPPILNPMPNVVSVAPSFVLAGTTDTPVTITGTGFIPSSQVQWNGASLTSTFSSATSLSVTIPASKLTDATVAKLTVLNPGPGGGTSTANFSVNNATPVINKIEPASMLAESGDTLVDITGTGFLSSSVVHWNGTALNATLVSTTEVKATIPASDLAGSSQSSITVVNPAPGGGASGAASFTVSSPVPAITAISPRYVPPGKAATIRITGTGFESNSMVLWNGSARKTGVLSKTAIQVDLTAIDLQNQGNGSLTVNNPGPGASTSPAVQLVVTSQPAPVIQSVSITDVSPGGFGAGGCPQLRVTITGQNFASNSTIQVNGISLPQIFYQGDLSTILNFLPQGFISKPGALAFTVTNPFPGIVSDPFPYPATNAPTIAVCAIPSPTTVYAGSSFSFTVQSSAVNVSSDGSVTLGSLPAGITATSSTKNVPLPPSGVTFHLKAANNTAVGTYDLTLNATVETSSTQGDFNFTVSTDTIPNFFFAAPLSSEVGVPIGGSGSIQYDTIVNSINSVDFDITPSVSGLPQGTSASFSPSVFLPGQSVTVTLTAASTAPVTQNASVTLTGTPAAQVANATASFLADVTQPPGSLPGNRTDFVSTAGTPFAAAYDRKHDLIFSSNPDWNRVDVISNATHKIVKSIPIRSPRGLDITQDNSRVWVQTASQNFYAIDTVSLQARHYSLPGDKIGSSGLPTTFSNDKVLALSDGTVFVFFNDSASGGGGEVGVWNPQTNQVNVLSTSPISAWGFPVRSGDGTRVYASNSTYDTGMEVYDVSTQSLSKINSGTAYPQVIAVNGDGSKLVLADFTGTRLYDHNLNLLGTVPGTLPSSISPFNGGILFDAGNSRIYEVGAYNGMPVVLTIDALSLKVLGTAPVSVTNPVGTSGAEAEAAPFAIDAAGMVLGVQRYGISFDDSTFYQNYALNQPNVSGGLIYTSTLAGPLAGGTVSSLYTFPNLTPDVWFDQTRGSVSTSERQLTFTSPPSATAGPVNLKFIYPDGGQAFAPQAFSYSTFPQYALMSGSGPDGGAPAQVIGYGLPQDASGGTVTVGANTATITSTVGQYPPFSGEPFPSAILKYDFPPGLSGFADLQITTPIGTGTLPKSIFYARSVTDYSSVDSSSFTAVLVDEKRKQVYLSAGDHIDVFSTASNQFVAPLNPVATGTQKQFAGLALTPDGSQLLAANLKDGSLAVINPDTASSISIPIAPAGPGVNNCAVDPLYVAATSAHQAFVATGSLPAPSCPPAGPVYIADLVTHAVTAASQCSGGVGLAATGDGTLVAVGDRPCLYSVQNSSYTTSAFATYQGGNGVTISADGNVLIAQQILADANLAMLGSIARPIPFYANSTNSFNPPNLLLSPKLNASGSLLYEVYPNYFEIIDVAHATLRMRFSLTETVANTASPLAIDSGGRFIYLITDKGLTVVDFAAAPLSIGHLSPQNAAPGAQILVRGSGFNTGMTATVGGVAASISVTDENTLTLTVPQASSGPQDIVLTRSDEVYTRENGVVLP